MSEIDLREIRNGYRGTEYRALIQHHIKRQSKREIEQGPHGTIELLPRGVHSLLETAIDEWNKTARHEQVWRTDTAEVFDLMIETARRVFIGTDRPPTADDLFNVFQVFVLTHSLAAAESRQLRRFAGIRKGLFG